MIGKHLNIIASGCSSLEGKVRDGGRYHRHGVKNMYRRDDSRSMYSRWVWFVLFGSFCFGREVTGREDGSGAHQ